MANYMTGSFGGVLSSLYRIHYLEFIFGALASSSISIGFTSDPTDDSTYAWGDWVSKSVESIPILRP